MRVSILLVLLCEPAQLKEPLLAGSTEDIIRRQAGPTLGDCLNYNVAVGVSIGLVDGCGFLTTENGRALERRSLKRTLWRVAGRFEFLECGADREDWNDRGFGSTGLATTSGYADADRRWSSWEGRAQ